ncbi:MAG: hypothetical protein ACLPM3_02415 [Terracidiphilus sp.]
MMNVLEWSRRFQRMGLGFVLISLLYFSASVLLVYLLVASTLLPSSMLRPNGKILDLAVRCLWIAVPGAILWLTGWTLKSIAKNKD